MGENLAEDLAKRLRWIARGVVFDGDDLRRAADDADALAARLEKAEDALRAVQAERDRAQKSCEQIAKRFTPRRLRYAPKDRVIIGVERPPFEDETFFYDLIWSERLCQFVTPYVEALNGATHFLDPRDLIGLPPQERLSREERQKATARAALSQTKEPTDD